MSSEPSGTGTAQAPIVFLHIPKTAGQTIHSELSRIVGADATSPIRVHTQAATAAGQFPPGYGLYSGHLDWLNLSDLPAPRFTFTVLRDPLERIASFYFYLRREAEGLTEEELQTPERTGMRMAKTLSADDYFFSGSPQWQRFIHDHYNNVYCAYFATRKIRGWQQISDLDNTSIFKLAMAGTKLVDRIYSVTDLGALEADIAAYTGQKIEVATRYVNAGPEAQNTLRWPKLCAAFENDKSAKKMHQFVRIDQRLMRRLDMINTPSNT